MLLSAQARRRLARREVGDGLNTDEDRPDPGMFHPNMFSDDRGPSDIDSEDPVAMAAQLQLSAEFIISHEEYDAQFPHGDGDSCPEVMSWVQVHPPQPDRRGRVHSTASA